MLLHLQLDETALDADGESVDCNVSGEVQRLPGVQVEPGAVPRALDPAALLVQLAALILPVSVVWGALYLSFGAPVGIVPFVYFTVSVASLISWRGIFGVRSAQRSPLAF